MSGKKVFGLLLAALVFCLLSADNIAVILVASVDVRPVYQQILKALAVSLFTTAIIKTFVDKQLSETLSKLTESPASFFGRVDPSEFKKYISLFLQRNYNIDENIGLTIWSILTKKIFNPQEYRENFDSRIIISSTSESEDYRTLTISTDIYY